MLQLQSEAGFQQWRRSDLFFFNEWIGRQAEYRVSLMLLSLPLFLLSMLWLT